MSQTGQYALGPSGGVPVEFLTGNTGGPVGPDAGNNINVVGDTTTVNVAGNPGTHTLTISASASIATTYDCDAGTAIPALNILNVNGGDNIHTSGVGNTITISVDGTTNHSLQLGNASGSLTSLGVAGDGFLPIGAAGADPVLATLTPGTGINITNAAGSITIDSTVVGGIVTLSGNTGTATGTTVNVIADTGEGTSLITGDNIDTLTLTFTDVDFNVVLGTSAFEATHTVGVGTANVGLGWHVLNASTDGGGNTAIGFNSLPSLTTGINNTGIGVNSLNSLTTGGSNLALGAGMNALLSGDNNIAIGGTSGATYTTNESNNILLNNTGVIGESNVMRLGTTGAGNNQVSSTYVAGVDGVSVGSTAKVVTMGTGGTVDQLGTTVITAGTGITITPGANTITISGDGTTNLTYTNVAVTPYVVLATDEYLSVDTSALAITVQLPNAPAAGRVYVVKDRIGDAATRNITVTTVGGVVNIDGATSFVMNNNFQAISLIFNGAAYEIF